MASSQRCSMEQRHSCRWLRLCRHGQECPCSTEWADAIFPHFLSLYFDFKYLINSKLTNSADLYFWLVDPQITQITQMENGFRQPPPTIIWRSCFSPRESADICAICGYVFIYTTSYNLAHLSIDAFGATRPQRAWAITHIVSVA